MTPRHEILLPIVEAIADAEDCSPHELDYSLYEYVETEALIALAMSDHTDWTLRFQVPDHTVEVRGDGRILVDDAVLDELNPAKLD